MLINGKQNVNILQTEHYNYGTIDLDLNARLPFSDIHLKDMIVEKISRCSNCVQVQALPSTSKGYHIFFYCKIKCDICRLVFDDDKRFMLDTKRPEYRQNVMFDEKGVKAVDVIIL